MTQYIPDSFDLNDWLVMHKPEVYRAIKYLAPTKQYECTLKIWQQAGCPDISQ